MKTTRSLVTFCIPTTVAVLLAACGGGASTGPGAGASSLVTISTQNAPLAAATVDDAQWMLESLATGDVADLIVAPYTASVSNEASEPAPYRQHIVRALTRGTQLAVEGTQRIQAATGRTPCSEGGYIEETANAVVFSNCLEEDEFERLVYNGSITMQPTTSDGYQHAASYTVDLTLEWLDKSDEYGDNGSVQGSGSFLRAFSGPSQSPDRVLLTNLNLSFRDRGTIYGEAFDETYGAGEMRYESSLTESWRTRTKLAGRVFHSGKGEAVLGGAVQVTTDEHLYEGPSEFPQGEKLVISGAGGSRLVLDYADDGNLLTVSLNGKPLRHFSARYEFDNWIGYED